MKEKIDIVYVVASKLGTIGMGSTAYNAIKIVDKSSELSYIIFCRGYTSKINLKKESIRSYGFLEYLSFPLRFLEKKVGLKIHPFVIINKILGRLIYKNLPNCKIYHTWMGIAPEAIKKAKRDGAILILEGANSHPLNSLEILNAEYKRFGLNELVKNPKTIEDQIELIKKFDYIMCPSSFVKDSFIKQGFDKKKLIDMPYGVNLDKFKIKNKNNKKIRFIFIGSIQLRKGIYYLLRAWEELKLKNAELIIIGRVWPDSKGIVNKYKNNKTIKFIGFDSNPQRLLEKSDVFISPSLEEGSALTCYEAMASGLPLIVTYNTGSVMRDKKEGFIIPIRDIEVLKEKIKYFYNNPKVIKKMGKNARKRVEQFSWDNYSERLAKEYGRILDEKRN